MRLAQHYAQLPELLYAPTEPTPVADPQWIVFNHDLSGSLGLNPAWSGPEGLAILSGQTRLEAPHPLAMAYAGHQFGHWVPILGDGRALMLGQHQSPQGQWWDIQLKGSGQTPFSRNGDGRSSIGPVVREFLASEAMAALGIPTTRSLAALSTGQPVQRDVLEPGGILVRVAQSHIRIGTFEYLARQGDVASTQALLEFCVEHYCPLLPRRASLALDWFEWLVERTAKLISAWMQVGFIHGVMNTDNCSVVGDTIDYGPFGFLDAFIPDQVYSSIDQAGRYAYNQQPAVATWNLARLAECLLPLINDCPDKAQAAAQEVLQQFPSLFNAAFESGITRKVGLNPNEPAHVKVAMGYLDLLASNEADMTLAFRRLGTVSIQPGTADESVKALFDDPQTFDAWVQAWRFHLAQLDQTEHERQASMNQVNPAFILRNHLAEQATKAAIDSMDFEPMKKLHALLQTPFDDQPHETSWAGPPMPEEQVLTTFCGT